MLVLVLQLVVLLAASNRRHPHDRPRYRRRHHAVHRHHPERRHHPTSPPVTLSQFQLDLNPVMCASGKSSWTGATGSGPFHLAPCRVRFGRPNRNTRIIVTDSPTPPYKILQRTNDLNQLFCLTGYNPGQTPPLAFLPQCTPTEAVQQWDLTGIPLVRMAGTNYCWDTLGNTAAYAPITLNVCDPSSKSQQFLRR